LDINRALYKARVPYWIYLHKVRWNDRGTITGTAMEMCTVEDLRTYRDMIIKVAHTVDRSIVRFEENET
jgi:hypothetical protein